LSFKIEKFSNFEITVNGDSKGVISIFSFKIEKFSNFEILVNGDSKGAISIFSFKIEKFSNFEMLVFFLILCLFLIAVFYFGILRVFFLNFMNFVRNNFMI
jgi:sRNA-binding regulator protein Hfq